MNLRRIKLNENISWHDGNKFDASDVIFTINSLKKLKNESIYYQNIKDISHFDKTCTKIQLYEFEEWQYTKNEYMKYLFDENKKLKVNES